MSSFLLVFYRFCCTTYSFKCLSVHLICSPVTYLGFSKAPSSAFLFPEKNGKPESYCVSLYRAIHLIWLITACSRAWCLGHFILSIFKHKSNTWFYFKNLSKSKGSSFFKMKKAEVLNLCAITARALFFPLFPSSLRYRLSICSLPIRALCRICPKAHFGISTYRYIPSGKSGGKFTS